ncbi:hypothetical protein KNJ79_15165 [Sphingopyxis indica]|uniref:hypothetical protein n=1 Tax=Sphingopyxis indica TaxID=436663 RepID=UPI002938FA10|nr:hypothetical protein [Sphingopyxis indica]WOF42504.1 hypothetical protein KNJ79_15165 [Sphingopyxis indica]
MGKLRGALILLTLAALPADAEERGKPPLFEIADVDRDTVPAGTPAAFEAIFGRAPHNEARREVGDSAYLFVPLTLIPLADGRTALVSTGSSECTGHACSGVNAVHYLQSARGSYTVEGEWLDVGASGTFGNPARRWGWSDAIAGDPVLYTEGGGVWQGYACSHAALTALTSGGPVEIAAIPVYYSSEGALDTGGTVLEGTITAAEKGRSFTVSYKGSRAFSERYVRGPDGRYAVRGGTKVPGC